jgi:predicted ATP-dependent protease
VILPKRNEPDLDDVPEEIRKQLAFIFAEQVDDVLAAALCAGLPKASPQEMVEEGARTASQASQLAGEEEPEGEEEELIADR